MSLENPHEIKYNSDVAVGGKIDLSKFANKKNSAERSLRPEAYLPDLKDKLGTQAKEINHQFSGFLGTDGRIAMEGIDAASDKQLVAAQEEGFSRDAGKSLEAWQKSSENNSAGITEMALTVMLHKFLKDDFIVALSAKFDDYNHKVDQVIIDKRTGEVICGFDEVITHFKDGSAPKKEESLARAIAKGGAELKYGAKLEQGKLVRSAVKNVPAFYLALKPEDLSELLADLKTSGQEITAVEARIFDKLIVSLEEQSRAAQGNSALKLKTDLVLEKLRRYSRIRMAA